MIAARADLKARGNPSPQYDCHSRLVLLPDLPTPTITTNIAYCDHQPPYLWPMRIHLPLLSEPPVARSTWITSTTKFFFHLAVCYTPATPTEYPCVLPPLPTPSEKCIANTSLPRSISLEYSRRRQLVPYVCHARLSPYLLKHGLSTNARFNYHLSFPHQTRRATTFQPSLSATPYFST